MKIGFDARHLRSFGTGGYRIIDESITALKKHCDLVKYNQDNSAFIADVCVKNFSISKIIKANNLDMLLHFLPPCSFRNISIPQISYILDIPEPKENTSIKNWIYNKLYIKETCKRSDKLITISNYQKIRIMDTYNIAEDKISVVYPALDLDFWRSDDNRGVRALSMNKYLLVVLSSMADRKHPAACIEVFSRLPDAIRQTHKMLVVGRPTSVYDFRGYVDKTILDRVKKDVVFLGQVGEKYLRLAYKQAAALLFASKYEGFGLPIIEAMACEIPVIASNIPTTREIVGKELSLYDVYDYDGMANRFCNIVQAKKPDGGWYNRRLIANKFAYDNYVKQMMNIFKEFL